MKNYQKLIIALILPFLVSFFGQIFTNPSIDTWYILLNKPELAPPNWVFAPVWTILYLMMGFAFYLVWKNKKPKKIAIYFFIIQLIFNAIWSPAFFGFHKILIALIIIIILDILVIFTIYFFFRINKHASFLLIPYLIWILFASFLNYQFLILN